MVAAAGGDFVVLGFSGCCCCCGYLLACRFAFNSLTHAGFVAPSLSPGAPLYIYSYYVLTNFLQDVQDQRVPALQSLHENNEKATEMLWPTMMQHWKLWPIVHSFNFYFCPLHHRVLVQVCVDSVRFVGSCFRLYI